MELRYGRTDFGVLTGEFWLGKGGCCLKQPKPMSGAFSNAPAICRELGTG